MGTKCAPPYACLVVGYKEETKLFPIELPTFFSTEDGRWIFIMASNVELL